MKRTRTLLPALALLALAALPAHAQMTLTAAKVDAPPALDGNASDAAWSKAQPLTVKLSSGANHTGGGTTATLKAIYAGDMLYMLVQYDDPTQSIRRGPFVKQADGSWKKLTDPDDKGGDNNKYYEDKWAMIWNIGASIKGFDSAGCFATCHAGEPGKPYGNKYTSAEGELGDIWHMKGVRTATVGQVDNQYVDHTRFDKEKSPEAGRKSNPNEGGGYKDVKLVGGKPEFMSKDGKAANKGGSYWLKDEDKVAFDDSKFVAGDEVASMLVAPFKGERGAIATAGSYTNGKYTWEVARKLKTGGKFDVQFDDLSKSYGFGFAAFDNAQVRHAWHMGAIQLKFQP